MNDTTDDITSILDTADLVQREARDEIIRLRAALTSAPNVPFGLLANNDDLHNRALVWFDRYISWQFNIQTPALHAQPPEAKR